MRIEVPELRIVLDELWLAVQAMRRKVEVKPRLAVGGLLRLPADSRVVASPGGFEIGNGDPRKLSAYAVLADKSRRLLGKPSPFRPV